MSQTKRTDSLLPNGPTTWDLLGDPHRRAVLDVLDGTDTVPLDRLVETVATLVGPRPGERVVDGTDSLRIQLVHKHLPKLDEAGALRFDRDRRRVHRTDSPLYDHPALRRGTIDDSVCRALASERRQTVVEVLAAFTGSVSLGDLAVHVVATAENCSLVDVDEAAQQRVVASLHHRDLPPLGDADLVAYDRDAREVELTDDLPVPAAIISDQQSTDPSSEASL